MENIPGTFLQTELINESSLSYLSNHKKYVSVNGSGSNELVSSLQSSTRICLETIIFTKFHL